jgi:hypothetical protein
MSGFVPQDDPRNSDRCRADVFCRSPGTDGFGPIRAFHGDFSQHVARAGHPDIVRRGRRVFYSGRIRGLDGSQVRIIRQRKVG